MTNKKYKILIVDDEYDNLETIVKYFELSGESYELFQALDATLALRIAVKELPDLIITDWEMPGVNGIELIKLLKKEKRTQEIPVIVCTGVMTSSKNLKIALNAGAVDYIRKPLDAIELLARTKASLNLADRYQDIKKLNKSIKELLKFKDDMTKMVIHDLKNPLNTLLNIDYIKDEDKLDVVKREGAKMLNLVLNSLDTYRYENTDFILNKAERDLNELLQGAKNDVKFLCDEKSVSVVLDLAQIKNYYGDDKILSRVLVNLLSNAIRFAPRNTPVKISCEQIANSVKLSVHNLGPHISEQEKDWLFEKFVSTKYNSNDTLPPSGLGLAFCKMAVEAHGGELGIESEEGKGATFWFTIPNERGIELANSNLSPAEKIVLESYYQSLQLLSVYDLTRVKKLGAQIAAQVGENNPWFVRLKGAIENCNQKLYQQLIEEISK